jgi:hypothetical protein
MPKKKRIKREGSYVPMPRGLMLKSRRMYCEVCGTRYGQIRATASVTDAVFLKVKQVCDHLFPVKFLLRLKLDPHVEVNMMSVCASCHGRKLKHEDKIFRGDVLGFMAGLNRIGYPVERVRAAAMHFGFLEVEKFVPKEQAEREFLDLTKDMERR